MLASQISGDCVTSMEYWLPVGGNSHCCLSGLDPIPDIQNSFPDSEKWELISLVISVTWFGYLISLLLIVVPCWTHFIPQFGSQRASLLTDSPTLSPNACLHDGHSAQMWPIRQLSDPHTLHTAGPPGSSQFVALTLFPVCGTDFLLPLLSVTLYGMSWQRLHMFLTFSLSACLCFLWYHIFLEAFFGKSYFLCLCCWGWY